MGVSDVGYVLCDRRCRSFLQEFNPETRENYLTMLLLYESLEVDRRDTHAQ